jgi:hypothetical protein
MIPVHNGIKAVGSLEEKCQDKGHQIASMAIDSPDGSGVVKSLSWKNKK